MSAEFMRVAIRLLAETRASAAVPPPTFATQCRNCGETIGRTGRTSTGWTHIGDWQGVRCQGALTGAVPQAEAQRSPEETLDRLDAAVEGRCPCGADPRPGSPYCSPDCEPTHRGPDTDAPWLGGPHAARWRPDLVTAFDDAGLELIEEMPAGRDGITRRWYRNADGRRFLRVDDGHRWVGAFAELADGPQPELWRRLERELSDRRRLDPEPATEPEPDGLRCPCGCGGPALSAAEVQARMRGALVALGAEGERAVTSGRPDPRAAGTVFWLPNRPADPEAPTVADLAGGVELGAGPLRPERESASERFRRVGEQFSGAVAFGQVVAGPFAETYRRCVAEAAQAESDRVALRAVCVDGAMYESALAAAEETGRTAAQMVEAVALGLYTEHGWEPPDLAGMNPALARAATAARAVGADYARMETEGGQRYESHICDWEPLMDSLRPHRCTLRWSDGTWCDQTTTDPDGEVRRAVRLVGPPATGDRL